MRCRVHSRPSSNTSNSISRNDRAGLSEFIFLSMGYGSCFSDEEPFNASIMVVVSRCAPARKIPNAAFESEREDDYN